LSAPGSFTEPVTFTTRDGSLITVRRIRPQDGPALVAGFGRLSEDSRYRRFLAATAKLSASSVRYLTDVDHRDHEALVALVPGTGQGVGVARYVRTQDGTAEAAVTVVDDWQGHGIGTLLLDLIALRAREEGIGRFRAVMLAENSDVLEMFQRIGRMEVIEQGAGTVEIEVALPRTGVGDHLRGLLRFAAHRGMPVPVHAPALESLRTADYSVRRIDAMDAARVGEELGVTALDLRVVDIAPHASGLGEHEGQEQVYAVLQGSAEMTVGGDRFPIDPGVLVRVGASQPRTIVTSDEPVRLLVFAVSEAFSAP
jgi:GNAT superfamily N-acetyltransferase/mannose-6-phosphate isomerase-like protein (cupin superfamily)